MEKILKGKRVFNSGHTSLDQALLFYTDPQNYVWKKKEKKKAKANKQKHIEKFEQFFPRRKVIWESCHC